MNTPSSRFDGFSDLAFFITLSREPTLAAAAQQLGVTPPAVSKRLAQLERRLGARLLNRTTRRTSLTSEGDIYLEQGARVLEALDTLERNLAGSSASPKGTVRFSATLGFGRRMLAPAISAFAKRYPDVEVQLNLSDRPVNLVEQGFDVVLRFGEQPDARLTARRLALNRRILCASPAYMQQQGIPQSPRELAGHACLFIRESDETFGTWHLSDGNKHESVKVRGQLSTNDGESALQWALDGHGIVMRSQWDVAPMLRSGKLQAVLPHWQMTPADIFLVFQQQAAPKVRVLIDFLLNYFKNYRSSRDKILGAW